MGVLGEEPPCRGRTPDRISVAPCLANLGCCLSGFNPRTDVDLEGRSTGVEELLTAPPMDCGHLADQLVRRRSGTAVGRPGPASTRFSREEFSRGIWMTVDVHE